MIFFIYFWWFLGILILMIFGFFSKIKVIKQIAVISWIMLFLLIVFLSVMKLFTTKMKLKQHKIYGEYVVDKNKFAGKQADWQYNNYRFEIKKDNKIYVLTKNLLLNRFKRLFSCFLVHKCAMKTLNFDLLSNLTPNQSKRLL